MGVLRRAEHGAVVAGACATVLVRRLLRGRRRPGWTLRTELAHTVMRTTLLRSKRKGVAWLRELQESFPARSKVLERVTFEPVDAGGVPGEWCRPLGCDAPARTVVYLHGGAYLMGSVASYRDTLGRLAEGVRAQVLGVDYRLAPEHAFPAAQEDALTATRWVLDQGVAPGCLAIAGDSAGGALSVATLCSLRDAGGPQPAAAVLLCPWTDPLADGGSMVTNELFDSGDRELLVGWIETFLAGADASDPRVTLLNADLEGLPPLLVQAGGVELLLDQVRAFTERAQAAGVDVEFEVYDDMFHVFQLQAQLLPEGARAMEAIVRFLSERLAAA